MRLSGDRYDQVGGSVLQAAYIIDDYGEVTLGACGRAHAARAFDTARSLVNDLGYIAFWSRTDISTSSFVPRSRR